MNKQVAALVAALMGLLVSCGIAQAHVTVHPNALPSGGFTVVNVNVPNERDKASTTKVDVQFPSGIIFLSTKPATGWSAKVIYRKLAKPVTVFGEQHTQEVDRVVWTGHGAAGRIRPGEFQQFPVSISVPTKPKGTILTFKALQTYSNGEIVRWIGAPSADEPAPQVLVTGANDAVEDYPGGITSAKKTRHMSSVEHGFVFGLPLLGAAAVAEALRRRRRS